MTFTDKKIEEFDEKFCRWEQTYTLDTIDNPTSERVVNNAIELSIFKNWLKQTLAEAEREGQIKELYEVRKILRDNGDPAVWEKIREKIIELEEKK